MRRSLTPEMFRPHPSQKACAAHAEWHSGRKIRVLLRCSSLQIGLAYGAIRIGSGFAAHNPAPGLLQPRNSRTPREEIHAEYFELQDDRSCFPVEIEAKNGAGGGNRTHGLG